MIIYLQHGNSYHLHEYFFWFLLLTPFLLIFIIYASYKLVNYMNTRADRNQEEMKKKKN